MKSERRTIHLLGTALLGLACLAAVPSMAAAASNPVWLCKPGLADNPCEMSLKTTLLSPAGEELGVRDARVAKRRRIDCFYVYPTASNQPGPLADLSIDPELRSIALYQAARYSSTCRVFAPVYRQRTLPALLAGARLSEEQAEVPYSDVRAAWRAYRRQHKRGRGVVVIGHSQGARMLVRLVAEEIEPRRSARRALVSAVLLGGDVTVRASRSSGGDFKRLQACRSARQLRCVIAFSAFNAPVPADALYGRTDEPGLEVLCTNPAGLRRGAGKLRLIRPTEPFAQGTLLAAGIALLTPSPPAVYTPWVEYRDAYRGRCSSTDGASVLQVSAAPGAPPLNAVPDPTWGLHVGDGNIALGNLVRLVRKQGAAHVRRARKGR